MNFCILIFITYQGGHNTQSIDFSTQAAAIAARTKLMAAITTGRAGTISAQIVGFNKTDGTTF